MAGKNGQTQKKYDGPELENADYLVRKNITPHAINHLYTNPDMLQCPNASSSWRHYILRTPKTLLKKLKKTNSTILKTVH
jgi:hypothetical protein